MPMTLCLATARPAPPGGRHLRGRPRRSTLSIRASASSGGDGGVDPAAELPGGVRWLSAPRSPGLGLGFGAAGMSGPFARVAGRGEGFVILEGGPEQEAGEKRPGGLQRMGRQEGAALVLGSALGALAPAHYDHLGGSDVIEVELVPIGDDGEEGEEEGEETIGQEECVGIVLHAALGGPPRGAPGLVPQAPKNPGDEPSGDRRRRSPRRTQPVRFTCNICRTRTTRVVNPFAWTHGTVFLECSGCHVKHKVKDNLNLFFEGRDLEPGSAASSAPPPPPPKAGKKKPRSPLLDPTNLSWALERDADWRLPGSNGRGA